MMYDNKNVSHCTLDSNSALPTLVTNYQYFNPEMHC